MKIERKSNSLKKHMGKNEEKCDHIFTFKEARETYEIQRCIHCNKTRKYMYNFDRY